jgi:hypothetical protein
VGIPALAITVFNPDTEKFSEISTKPIALSVSAGSAVAAGDLVGSLTGSGTQDIRSQAQGIFQNVTDPAELTDQRVNVLAMAEITVGLWCAVGCLTAFVASHRRKSGDVVWQRKRGARRTAQRKLAEARSAYAAGDSRAALRATRSALVGLIADMLNIVGEGLTASEADAALASTAVPEKDRADVRRLLEAIESSEYGSSLASETSAMIETAAGLVPKLARLSSGVRK